MIRRTTLPLLVIAATAVSCKGPVVRPVGAPLAVEAPLGLPPVPIPPDNPPTAETIALGRRLFYETAVSRDNQISCASCHAPGSGFADPRVVSLGVTGVAGIRNAPTVVNAAYLPFQFWDGRAASLEEQAAGPIANSIEMDHPHERLVRRLRDDTRYVELFAAAFGPGPITVDHVCKAIASFERTVLSGNSPFDRYRYGGDAAALSAAAQRGLALFTDANKGNCSTCHTIGPRHALFTDGKFHNIGAGMNSEGELRDLGRFAVTKNESDRGAFRTPSLRNVALTAPYMHDGSLKTLGAVLDFYTGGGNSNPHLDREIRPLRLTREERTDIVAFLESLTGELPPNVGPPQ